MMAAEDFREFKEYRALQVKLANKEFKVLLVNLVHREYKDLPDN